MVKAVGGEQHVKPPATAEFIHLDELPVLGQQCVIASGNANTTPVVDLEAWLQAAQTGQMNPRIAGQNDSS